MAANPTIVLLPAWGVGHFMPMIEAGKRMLQRSSSCGALSLTVLLMPAPTAQAASDIAEHVRREQEADIRFLHLPPVQLPTDHTGVEEWISRIVQLHVPHIGAAVSGLTCPVAALVVDIFCTPALDVSRDLAVPAYVYFTSGAAMLALLLRSPSLQDEVEGEFEGAVEVPGLPPVPPSFLPETLLDKRSTTYTWFLYTGRRYMEANGIIVNTAAELEPGVLAAIAEGRCTRGVRAPTVYPIGPAISLISPPAEQPHEPHECVRWLDSQPPSSVLFLCFGSKGTLPPPQVHEIARGLERSGHRFLWVLRGLPTDTTTGAREPTDANLAELLPEGFLEKTKGRGLVWPARAPQKEVLAHASVGGFVTHCGWNSILESLWFGVPMLPWPLGADQHLNAFALVHEMGAAVALEVDRKRGNYVEAAGLERAVRSLMGGGEEGVKAREKAMAMKRACRNAVEQSGSSHASLQRLSEELVGGAVQPKRGSTYYTTSTLPDHVLSHRGTGTSRRSPSRELLLTQGVSVVSDGWTNIKNKPLINVNASNSRGSCFLYAEDYSGIEKTGEAIGQFLLKAIEEIGPKNVIQVVTDNASNCKVAGREIQKVHNHIFWSPCVVHTLNLIFKDFANKFPWMLETYRKGKAIVNFFQSHTHCIAMFRNHSRLELLKVAKTRFATHYILLKRLSTVREALSTTVVTRQWKDWVRSSSSEMQQQTKAIVDTINDENFWNEVDNILAITGPIYSVLRFSDGECPKMGEIYERMDNMVGEIKDIMTQDDNPHKLDYPDVEEIIMGRWEKMNIPLHSLAFALNPKYYDQRYIENPAPGGFVRKAPNKDPDVMKGVLEALKKIGDDASEQQILREQFTYFISKKGMYALNSVKQDAYNMDAIDWWQTYGSETPDLATVAIKILSQPISSSSAERIWSTYEYIHNAKRNKLNAQNADKLVFIHSNLRLLSRITESYKNGPHSKWDIDPSNSTI